MYQIVDMQCLICLFMNQLCTYMSTTGQKFETVKIFNVSVKSLLHSERLHLFDRKHSKNSNIVKYYYNFKITVSNILIYFKMQIIPLMPKLNFQQPLLQSSVSHESRNRTIK